MAKNSVRKQLNWIPLLPIGLLLFFLLIAGLVIDMARLVHSRNEARKAAQSAAEAAAMLLDGTPEGLRRARARAEDLMAVRRETGYRLRRTTVEFAAQASGPWHAAPEWAERSRADLARMVRVRAEATTPLLATALLPTGMPTVGASAMAGQFPRNEFRQNVLPYGVVARDDGAPCFGLKAGRCYTLRWPGQIEADGANVCEGDRDEALLQAASVSYRGGGGFIEIEYEPLVEAAILEGLQRVQGRIGVRLHPRPGRLARESEAFLKRIESDTDLLAPDYATYASHDAGNGRRVAAVMIHSGAPDFKVVQVGAFFLLPAAHYPADANHAFCAEFIGSYVEGSPRRGVAPAGYYVARLAEE